MDAETADIDIDESILVRDNENNVTNIDEISALKLGIKTRSKLFDVDIWCSESIEGYGHKLTHCKFGEELPVVDETGMPGCLDWQVYDKSGNHLNDFGFVVDIEGNELETKIDLSQRQ